MSNTVSRSEFKTHFKHGIDVEQAKAAIGIAAMKTVDLTTVDDPKAHLPMLDAARAGGEAALVALDRNKDGKIAGKELEAAFRLVDGFDGNGKSTSFQKTGAAKELFGALDRGRIQPYFGASIAAAAKDRAATQREGYALANAPKSPYGKLSGNRVPNETEINWLKNNNKCNQFVGDALVQAGMQMPVYKMDNGGHHYVNADALPRQTEHFDKLTDRNDLKAGDVIVVDYASLAGANGGHTEVVTSTEGGAIKSAGAHADGAYERDWSNLLDGATYHRSGSYWEKPNGDKIYLLRPVKPQDASPAARI